MKLLLNKCFGSFSLNPNNTQLLEKLNHICPINSLEFRANKDVINILEDYMKKGYNINSEHSKITIVDIPDNITDFTIQDYDGWEICIFVIDGKLYSDEQGKLYK